MSNWSFHFFWYALACLWNQLPISLPQLHSSLFVSGSPLQTPVTSCPSVDSPPSTSITLSLVHSGLKIYLFTNHHHRRLFLPQGTASTDYYLDCFFWLIGFCFQFFSFFGSVWQVKLATCQLLGTRKCIISCCLCCLSALLIDVNTIPLWHLFS